jgi:hypothetical protein
VANADLLPEEAALLEICLAAVREKINSGDPIARAFDFYCLLEMTYGKIVFNSFEHYCPLNPPLGYATSLYLANGRFNWGLSLDTNLKKLFKKLNHTDDYNEGFCTLDLWLPGQDLQGNFSQALRWLKFMLEEIHSTVTLCPPVEDMQLRFYTSSKGTVSPPQPGVSICHLELKGYENRFNLLNHVRNHLSPSRWGGLEVLVFFALNPHIMHTFLYRRLYLPALECSLDGGKTWDHILTLVWQGHGSRDSGLKVEAKKVTDFTEEDKVAARTSPHTPSPAS